MKKYYDENNYVVGVSYGEMTSVSKDATAENIQQLVGILSQTPQKNGYAAHLVETVDGGFISYNFEFEKLPESELSDEAIKEMLQEEIMNSIIVGARPAGKEGYALKPVFNGTSIVWEFVKNEAPSEDEDVTKGTYLNPIEFVPGMEVKVTKWYTDGSDIWECIKSGTPSSFSDTEYFDVIA